MGLPNVEMSLLPGNWFIAMRSTVLGERIRTPSSSPRFANIIMNRW